MHKPLLFYYHFLSVVDVDAFLCRTFFSHFLTIQVVPAFGINGFCLELDERNARHALVVVVREGNVRHASPDVFLQTRIVDEGVASGTSAARCSRHSQPARRTLWASTRVQGRMFLQPVSRAAAVLRGSAKTYFVVPVRSTCPPFMTIMSRHRR